MPKKIGSRTSSASTQDDADAEVSNTGNDSEVVEVIKVGRSRKDASDAQRPSNAGNSMKRSTTFRIKAAKAFNSIRSLGKGTKQRKSTAMDAFPPSGHSQPTRAASFSSFGQERSPSRSSGGESSQASHAEKPLARRGSVVLTQIFSPKVTSTPVVSPSPSTIESIPSVSSTIDSSSSQFTLESTQSASPSLQLERVPNNNQQPPSQDVLPETLGHPQSSVEGPTFDSERGRPTSPSLTLNTLSDKTSKRRFSMMSIRQIFTFSPSTSAQSNAFPIPTSDPSAEARDSDAASLSESELGVQLDPPRLSRTTAGSSTDSSDSSSGVETPTEEATFLPMAVDEPAVKRNSADWKIPELDSFGTGLDGNFADSLGDLKGMGVSVPGSSRSLAAGHKGDVSFEMKLDSLHFDSLSFDADKFNISEILKD
ncbi:hypothetical protein ONZ45_g15569 [Pleurotus djamor]|nr:hypothetical protein ONZ45_g15569 [Pleurotus djamor]